MDAVVARGVGSEFVFAFGHLFRGGTGRGAFGFVFMRCEGGFGLMHRI